MKKLFEVKCSIEEKDVENILYSAANGASYWCSNELEFESVVKRVLSGKGDTKMYDHEGGRNYTLTLAHIKRGIAKLAKSKEYTHHWLDIMKDNTDNITGDVFLQFCLFGKVKYS